MAHQQPGASTSNDTKHAVQNSGRLSMDATKGLSPELGPSPRGSQSSPAENLDSSDFYSSSFRDDVSTKCDPMVGPLSNCPIPNLLPPPVGTVVALNPLRVAPVEGIGDRHPICDIAVFVDKADGSLIDFTKLAVDGDRALADLFFGENDGGLSEGEMSFNSHDPSDDQVLRDDEEAEINRLRKVIGGAKDRVYSLPIETLRLPDGTEWARGGRSMGQVINHLAESGQLSASPNHASILLKSFYESVAALARQTKDPSAAPDVREFLDRVNGAPEAVTDYYAKN